MPRTKSPAWSQLKVGALFVAALVILAVTIVMISGETGFFWQKYNLKIVFSDIGGLKPGAPVRLAGVEIGSASTIAFTGSRVEVAVKIKKEMRDKIRTDSRAELGSLGLLGEKAIDITPGLHGQVIPEWGYIPSSEGADLKNMTAVASRGLNDLSVVLQEVREGKGTLGRLVRDERLYEEMNRFIASAADVSARLERGGGTVGKLVNDPAVYHELEASVRSLNAILGRVRAGQGGLGRLVDDESFARNLSSTSAHLDAISARLQAGEGSAGKLLQDSALYDRLNQTAERLERLSARLDQGQGTVGRLMTDKELYDNLNRTVNDLHNLVADIRKDPSKYLRVKVSIF